ncbi:MAG: hypothetical protein AVDCRST_MAG49-1890, partial [uncultured Thermomicrobiales bacterium]
DRPHRRVVAARPCPRHGSPGLDPGAAAGGRAAIAGAVGRALHLRLHRLRRLGRRRGRPLRDGRLGPSALGPAGTGCAAAAGRRAARRVRYRRQPVARAGGRRPAVPGGVLRAAALPAPGAGRDDGTGDLRPLPGGMARAPDPRERAGAALLAARDRGLHGGQVRGDPQRARGADPGLRHQRPGAGPASGDRRWAM